MNHSYPRKTTREPSLDLQSTKPTLCFIWGDVDGHKSTHMKGNDILLTTLHVTLCACLVFTLLLMDRRVMAFVCPLIIKLTATLWAFDLLQLGGPKPKHQLPDNNDLLQQCTTPYSDHLRGSSDEPDGVSQWHLSLE